MCLDLHYSILLAQELERTAGEPLTSCYLMPEHDGHRIVREPLMQALQRMDLSSLPASATCSLKTPSDRLLGFAYYPRHQHEADRLAARLEPSFIVDADTDLHEMTYLIDGTNDEVSHIRALIDVDGDADCRTAGLFLIPFRGGSLATPWRAKLDDGLALKVHKSEAVRSMITAFQEQESRSGARLTYVTARQGEGSITNMNRWPATDSLFSLDGEGATDHHSRMKKGEQFQVYLERRAASKNMARYYAISLEHTLLGEVIVVRRWGRIGFRGRLKTSVAENELQGIGVFAEALRSKRKRGYKISRSER